MGLHTCPDISGRHAYLCDVIIIHDVISLYMQGAYYNYSYAHSLVEERRGGDMLMDMLIYAHIWRQMPMTYRRRTTYDVPPGFKRIVYIDEGNYKLFLNVDHRGCHFQLTRSFCLSSCIVDRSLFFTMLT